MTRSDCPQVSEGLTSPAGDALGVTPVSLSPTFCVMSLAAAPQNQRTDGAGFDRSVLLLLADQCMGSVAARNTGQAWLTLDLRADWFAAPDTDVVHCRAAMVFADGRRAYVVADLLASDDTLVGRCTGQFFEVPSVTNRPGGWESIDGYWSSFDAFLDLTPEGNELHLPPAPRLVGWAALPAVHGGLVAASLEKAMLSRAAEADAVAVVLRRLDFEFLRPAHAGLTVALEARWVRKGRNVAFLEATARQHGSLTPVVTARATVILDGTIGAANLSHGEKNNG